MVAGCLWLCGCERLLLAVPVEVGLAVAEERSVVDAIDDLTIRLALNDVFIREDARLYRAVSFSVVEGRVLLKGSVPTPQDRVRALGLAKGVAGVREAIDGLQVGEDGGTLAYMQEAWISTQLRTRVVLDLAVLHINYDVETVNGVVYLIGIAQDEEELERVVAHAHDIPGVRRVANHVTVKDHSRRLPRVREQRGRRTRARRGNAASGATPGSGTGYGHRHGSDASCQARPEGGKVGPHVCNIGVGCHALGDGHARVGCRAGHCAWVSRRRRRIPQDGVMASEAGARLHALPSRARTARLPGLQARYPDRLRCRPLSVFSTAGVSLELA